MRRLPLPEDGGARTWQLGAPGYSGGMPLHANPGPAPPPPPAAAAAAIAAGTAAAADWSTHWSTPAARSMRPGDTLMPRGGEGFGCMGVPGPASPDAVLWLELGTGAGFCAGLGSAAALPAPEAALAAVLPLMRGIRPPAPWLGRMSLSGSESGCATLQLRRLLGALGTLCTARGCGQHAHTGSVSHCV